MIQRILLTTSIYLFLSISASGQVNGQIVETSPYKFASYQDLPQWMKNKYTSTSYEEAFINSSTTELKKIQYLSDGLRVGGFIYQPILNGDKKLPVIVYNRAGVGEGARISNENYRTLYEMFKCAASGFIVVASQYRGVDGGQGKDEVGGADVNDVMNLLPLIKTLPHADINNIFLWGSSRGGTMALQVLRSEFPARAVALVGAVVDWDAQLKHDDRLGKEFWPDFENRREEHIIERSALRWIEKIPNIPILIMHGGNDDAVAPEQSLNFANKLNEMGKLFELRIFANDDHMIMQHLDEKIEAVIDWFQKPRLISIAKTFDRLNKKEGITAAIITYNNLKQTASSSYYDFNEKELNYLGYSYLFGGLPKDAITVFKLNTEAYPNSYAAWDSLAEAYDRTGDKDQTIKCYQKVLALDPGNKNATDALKKLLK